MGSPISLRDDFDAEVLRRLAKTSGDANQTRRLLALAVIYDGGARSDAARIGGVGLQVIRDWVLRINVDGPQGLIDRKAPGPLPKLNDDQREALARLVETGPIPATHGVVRWRSDGPGTLDMGGIPHLAGRDHRRPGAEGVGFPQAFRPPASPCAE